MFGGKTHQVIAPRRRVHLHVVRRQHKLASATLGERKNLISLLLFIENEISGGESAARERERLPLPRCNEPDFKNEQVAYLFQLSRKRSVNIKLASVLK